MNAMHFFYTLVFTLLGIHSSFFAANADMKLTLANKSHQLLTVRFSMPLADGSTSKEVAAGAEKAVIVSKDWRDKAVKLLWLSVGDVDTIQFTKDNEQLISTSNDRSDDGKGDLLAGGASEASAMTLMLKNKSDKVLIVHFPIPLANGATSKAVMAGAEEPVVVSKDWKDKAVDITWESPVDEDIIHFTAEHLDLISTSNDKTNDGKVDVLE